MSEFLHLHSTAYGPAPDGDYDLALLVVIAAVIIICAGVSHG